MSEHIPNDMLQPREVTNGYFINCEQQKDFIDFLFDVKEIGDYKELFAQFIAYENRNNTQQEDELSRPKL